jgi:Mg-chelatase subunit ChlD
MNAHFTVASHPQGSDSWLYYYLYSIERVGRILDTEFIGDHEWYPLGAQALIAKQKADGAWKGEGEEDDERIASSFALLFLTRATPSLAEPQRTGPGMLKTAVSLPPGRKLYIILDASGSMLEEMDGKSKFEIARAALASLIKELPPNAEVALRAYGYRRRAIEEGANEDSNLIVPMAPVNKEKLLMIVNGIRARGKTPLAYSLEQAVRELPQGTEEAPVTVLLLTDGGEDTQPRRDPVAAAKAYAKLENVRLRIVGFDINRDDWSQQLQAMAAASNGQYLPAARGDALLRELRASVFETPESFTVVDDSQKQVAAGKFGESVQLPAGKYRIRAAYGGRAFEETMWINAGTTTAVTFEAVNVAAASATAAPTPAAPAATASPTPAPAATAAPAQMPPAKAKFCTSCGAALKLDTKFCTQCGAKVGS